MIATSCPRSLSALLLYSWRPCSVTPLACNEPCSGLPTPRMHSQQNALAQLAIPHCPAPADARVLRAAAVPRVRLAPAAPAGLPGGPCSGCAGGRLPAPLSRWPRCTRSVQHSYLLNLCSCAPQQSRLPDTFVVVTRILYT